MVNFLKKEYILKQIFQLGGKNCLLHFPTLFIKFGPEMTKIFNFEVEKKIIIEKITKT